MIVTSNFRFWHLYAIDCRLDSWNSKTSSATGCLSLYAARVPKRLACAINRRIIGAGMRLSANTSELSGLFIMTLVDSKVLTKPVKAIMLINIGRSLSIS